ncbi:hypothetical protein NQK81_13435 [Amycolatopsis roodepoortensis]|uniref:hypothetical protein n=1 Tax=Amycolatopsis roodepoortensis TaxID=700274 RepID=UPI00214B136C|nr:hypothetical protein [Amycolatopsis roodepoortensis]UUV34408.1 hypothetical protein NQK81_13435 [Amycolatopsis roodepoortensis]
MTTSQRMNATDLRHAFGSFDQRLRARLAEAAEDATRDGDASNRPLDLGEYRGLRVALHILHAWTRGEFGVDGEEVPFKPLPGDTAGGGA